MKTLAVGLGQRPFQSLKVTTRDGRTYDLGRQVAGNDPIARFFQWRQKRKIAAYIRDRQHEFTEAHHG